jgi:hypothetical protein
MYIQKKYINCTSDDFSDEIAEILILIKDINYSPETEYLARLKSLIIDIFSDAGFVLDPNIDYRRLTITGKKDDIGLSVQTGNISRFYADLLKLQWFFDNNRISKSIYFCLTKNAASRSYSGNLANFERATDETLLFAKSINIPILFIGMDFE